MGEIDDAKRGGVRDRIALARDELVVSQLLVEFLEEAREPGLVTSSWR